MAPTGMTLEPAPFREWRLLSSNSMPALSTRGKPADQAAPARAFGGGPLQRDALLAAPLRCLPDPSRLDRPLNSIRGVGPKLQAAAERIGVRTLGDLVEHVPHGYVDRAEASEIAELRIGQAATIVAEVRTARVRPTRRRNLRIVEATVADGSGAIKATWFNQAWLGEQLRPGRRLLLSGRHDRQGFRVDAHEFLDQRAGDGGEGSAIRSATLPGRPPACTRRASSRSIRPGTGCASSGSANGPGRRSRSLPTSSSRCRRSSEPSGGSPGPLTPASRSTSRGTRATSSSRGAGSPTRSSSSTRRRC